MTVHRMPAVRCPQCQKRLDAAAALEAGEDNPPSVGDITLCLGCGSALEFTPAGFHALTILEFAALPREIQEQLERGRTTMRKMAAWERAERN